ncbi:MAG: ABC transporter permease [Peptococcaceae bacterium]|nr:ABC transporter permease [Peptococcaceae bacterium]
MWRGCVHLLRKDFKLMLSSKFFLLAIISLVLYSCYINFVYVHLDQEMIPVYLYDPQRQVAVDSEYMTRLDSRVALETACADSYAVGFDFSGAESELYMRASGLDTTDHYRMIWGEAVLSGQMDGQTNIIGSNNKEMKNRREITAEFLFFELTAVGFLGLASMLFKEKQMGVMRVHGILPIPRGLFIFSKLMLLLLSDLVFTILLTLINLGVPTALDVLPGVLLQASLLSMMMTLIGFLCAIWLQDFKGFSLFYLVLAVFVTTPVFLAGQTGISWDWMVYHPMHYVFTAMKAAFFSATPEGVPYYLCCLGTILLLALLSYRALNRELTREG